MPTTKRSTKIAAGLAACALFLGACGSDDDNGEAATATEAPAAETTAMEEMDDTTEMDEGMEEMDDIVDTAVAAGSFETLVAAVQAAELEDTLRGDGPFTVFAPSDDAFAALPDGTVEMLLEDPSGDLTSILTYHVVEGAVMAADLTDGQEVTTVNGATFTVGIDGDMVMLTDAAGNEVGVTTADVEASNGVIHVIDSVLMPS